MSIELTNNTISLKFFKIFSNPLRFSLVNEISCNHEYIYSIIIISNNFLRLLFDHLLLSFI